MRALLLPVVLASRCRLSATFVLDSKPCCPKDQGRGPCFRQHHHLWASSHRPAPSASSAPLSATLDLMGSVIWCESLSDIPEDKMSGATVRHIKGSGGGMDEEDLVVAHSAVCSWLQEERNTGDDGHDEDDQEGCRSKLLALVWDGDSFGVDSFTSVIPAAVGPRSSLENVTLIAFLTKESKGRFQSSWSKVDLGGQPIYAVVLKDLKYDTMKDWAQLGKAALGHTGCRRVICVGGGDTTREEASVCPDVTFHVLPLARERRGRTVPCSLLGLGLRGAAPLPNVIEMSL